MIDFGTGGEAPHIFHHDGLTFLFDLKRHVREVAGSTILKNNSKAVSRFD